MSLPSFRRGVWFQTGPRGPCVSPSRSLYAERKEIKNSCQLVLQVADILFGARKGFSNSLQWSLGGTRWDAQAATTTVNTKHMGRVFKNDKLAIEALHSFLNLVEIYFVFSVIELFLKQASNSQTASLGNFTSRIRHLAIPTCSALHCKKPCLKNCRVDTVNRVLKNS